MMDSIPTMTSLPATFFVSSSKLTSLLVSKWVCERKDERCVSICGVLCEGPSITLLSLATHKQHNIFTHSFALQDTHGLRGVPVHPANRRLPRCAFPTDIPVSGRRLRRWKGKVRERRCVWVREKIKSVAIMCICVSDVQYYYSMVLLTPSNKHVCFCRSFYQTNLGAIDGQVFANLTALTAL